jgi:hypothetical protein
MSEKSCGAGFRIPTPHFCFGSTMTAEMTEFGVANWGESLDETKS